ncbi:MAG: DUF805 domain-containing protein [Thiohalorhabdaceae bacterium]
MYSFSQAVGNGFAQAFDFQSRAVRSEYWFWVLFVFLVNIGASVVDVGLYGSVDGPVSAVALLALLIPGLAYAVRRFHDLGRTGWWVLLMLVPVIGQIAVLIWFVQPGDEGPNDYGPDRLAIEPGGA